MKIRTPEGRKFTDRIIQYIREKVPHPKNRTNKQKDHITVIIFKYSKIKKKKSGHYTLFYIIYNNNRATISFFYSYAKKSLLMT